MNKSILIALIIIIVLGYIAFSRVNRSKGDISGDTPTQTVSQGQFSINREAIDLGNMKVTDEKTAEFMLNSIGSSALAVSLFETSCDCTFGKIIIASTTSPEFNMRMHVRPEVFAWKADIEPGQQVKILVTYKPSIMPVYGKVERALRFQTSDPVKPTVELKVTATVQ